MHQSIRSIVDVSTTVALYARVSTEDQAERQTIQTQLAHLRQYANLYSLTVSDEYLDDGVSGTLPLERRPEGSRLLQDAEAGRFGSVVVYRLDRLGRELRVTMDAHDALQAHGVALRSSTEQLDTSTPNGRMIFQIMSSFSELEKNTITERTSAGRRRVASEGRYTGGTIPYGYDVDEDKCFIPSTRMVSALGMTESEMVADLFQRVVAGATVGAEAKRLTALGVPRPTRYGGSGGKVVEKTSYWEYSSLVRLFHNPAYKGEGVVKSAGGAIMRPMPPLVSPALWDRAQEAITRNKTQAKRNGKRDYWLRGLMRCATCGASYTGTTVKGVRKYRCSTQRGGVTGPCRSRSLHADWIESAVWGECVRFIQNPGKALEEARQSLRASMGKAAGFESRRRTVLAELTSKDRERERILTLYRKGVIDDADAEHQLAEIAREKGQLQETLESMKAQTALLEAQEAYLTDSATMLARLQTELAEIEATNDWRRRRQVIEQYVRRMAVRTIDTGKAFRDAEVTLHLRLQPEPIAIDTMMSRRPPRPASRWRSTSAPGCRRGR